MKLFMAAILSSFLFSASMTLAHDPTPDFEKVRKECREAGSGGTGNQMKPINPTMTCKQEHFSWRQVENPQQVHLPGIMRYAARVTDKKLTDSGCDKETIDLPPVVASCPIFEEYKVTKVISAFVNCDTILRFENGFDLCDELIKESADGITSDLESTGKKVNVCEEYGSVGKSPDSTDRSEPKKPVKRSQKASY